VLITLTVCVASSRRSRRSRRTCLFVSIYSCLLLESTSKN